MRAEKGQSSDGVGPLYPDVWSVVMECRLTMFVWWLGLGLG